MQSTLPDEYKEKLIKGMQRETVGYTVPWAMYADSDGALWIRGDYSVDRDPFGTVHMKIERTYEGVIVYKSTIGDHKYTPQLGILHNNWGWLPVTLK